jgi:hypothetical protein
MAKYVLFVEGADAVRIGLGPLLAKGVRRGSVMVKAIGDINRTIKRFLDEVQQPQFPGTTPLLLIDLDGPAATVPAVLAAKGLTPHTDHTFWMVQEMEAWFLSQPTVIDRVFKKPVSAHLPNTAPAAVVKPGDALAKATKTARAEPYHKTSHPPDLLARLDLPTLRRAFADVERLIGVLNG